jgi:hypothetical protein
LKNKAIADSLARDIMFNYLDKLPLQALITEENLSFIGKNPKLVVSSDILFKIAIADPERLDTVRYKARSDKPKWAAWLTKVVIQKEEVTDKIPTDGSAANFDFGHLTKQIKEKYPSVDTKTIVLEALYLYYAGIRNWLNYALYYDKYLKAYPPSGEGSEPFFALNGPAWNLFKVTNDKDALKFALTWSDLSIKLKPALRDNLQFLDTRANLLYKLGRTQEAIEQENAAVAGEKLIAEQDGKKFDASKSEYARLLSLMQQRLPTWPVKNP